MLAKETAFNLESARPRVNADILAERFPKDAVRVEESSTSRVKPTKDDSSHHGRSVRFEESGGTRLVRRQEAQERRRQSRAESRTRLQEVQERRRQSRAESRTRLEEARASRRQSRANIRTNAIAVLETRGYRDRKSGGFPVPDADLEEPARTERLLASPFAM